MATIANSRRTSTRTIVLIAIGVVAALAYIVAGRIAGDNYWLRMVAKPIPVLCLALWVSWLPRRGRYQGAIAAGLLLCALGDILLEASDATFLFGQATEGRTTLSCFDVRGAEVLAQDFGYLGAGTHLFRWDGCRSDGRRLEAGTYFARLSVGGRSVGQKIVVLP